MDVQGHEFYVLKGAQKTVKRSEKMIILSEFWPQGIRYAGAEPIRYLELISDLGFSIYELKGKHLIRINGKADFEKLVASLQGIQYANIVCFKGVKYNEADQSVAW